jgi:hypothetical protein
MDAAERAKLGEFQNARSHTRPEMEFPRRELLSITPNRLVKLS